jgi:hypothetical protein
MINAIAAHKDDLNKLLENLSGEIAVSGITFVALVDAYSAASEITGELIWNQH